MVVLAVGLLFNLGLLDKLVLITLNNLTTAYQPELEKGQTLLWSPTESYKAGSFMTQPY